MLRQRVITAAILVPLVVAGILWLPTFLFALLLGAIVLMGAREAASLCGVRNDLLTVGYMLLTILGMWGLERYFDARSGEPLQLLMGLVWSVLTLGLLTRRKPLSSVEGLRPGMLLLVWVILCLAWFSVIVLHARSTSGPELVLFLFVLIWVADSGAYFAGRAFGRHKLTPMVSPGKTWEGVLGALLGAALCGVVLVQLQLTALAYVPAVMLAIVVSLVSVGGDLYESLLKRQAQVKDSGTLLPGHGGALDRIDSLLAAAPVFVVGLALLERYA